MNFSAILTMAMQRLGNRTEATLRTGLLSELVLAQEWMERQPFKPWFLNKTLSTNTLNLQDFLLLDNFLGFDEEIGHIARLDTTRSTPDKYVHLKKVDREDGQESYLNESAGKPEVYWLEYDATSVSTKIIFRPVPDAVYTLRFMYLASATPVPTDGTGSNVWTTFAPDLMLAEVCRVGALHYIQNPTLAEGFAQEYTRAMDRLVKETTTRYAELRDYQMNREEL